MNAVLVGAVAWALLHVLWQGGVVAGVVATFLAVERGRSARARHAVAWGGLVVLVAAPVATAAWLALRGAAGAAALEGGAGGGGGDVGGPGGPAGVVPALASLTVGVSPWVAGAWFAGVVVALARCAGAWRGVRRVADAGDPAPGRWREELRRLKARLGIRRAVGLRVSGVIDTPMLVGWARPTILLPARLLDTLPAGQLRLLLAHELVHVRRGDPAMNALQMLAEAVLFFHPAAWWISRRVREERERCCDDDVVRFSADPLGYARALAGAEEARARTGRPALAATGGALLERIRRLVAPERPRSATASALAAAIACAGFAGLLAASSVAVRPAAAALTAIHDELAGRATSHRNVPPHTRTPRLVVHATDPAGEFTLDIENGRVVAATVDRVPLPADRIVQVGDSVGFLAPTGERILAVALTGDGIRWDARSPRL
jgi:beta-lactamase regulating signal transducer with metallopeptidase domain